MLTLEQGRKLIDLARRSIYSGFSGRKPNIKEELKKEFSEPRGAFVTLYISGNLRGCIGFTDAIFPLYDAIARAAQSAAFGDPRFPHLSKDEFPDISIEVSILTKPRAIHVRNPEDYLNLIDVGKDGLIVKGTFHSGLLLPQVAVEYRWDAKTFLEQTCIKAGIQKDSWQDYNETRIYKFQSHVFAENSPEGQVYKKM